jgi:DNA polymerase-3 subunit gamma/tau
MVRYLRNALMAKLGGEQTELLQISTDERSRAVRTALLFTEEELTRNLQIVLRTFDDLNYRQEQRFHLELGLLKLIHAQRLLPLEELLSGAASGRVPSTPPPSRPAGSPSGSSSRPTASSVPAQPATSPISPFGPTGGSWSSSLKAPQPTMDAPVKTESTSGPTATLARTSPAIASEAVSSPFLGSAPFPATAAPSSFATVTEGALARLPEPAQASSGIPSSGIPSIDQLRHAIGSALVAAGHTSAAEFLGTASWNIDGASLRIEVPGLGKKMLALTFNTAAEKIIRQELQRLGGPARFLIVPGEAVAAASQPASNAAPIAGSMQEAALSNPLVQRAKEIFKAEVRSVVDLRQK